jgi:hypothetical protein
VLAVAAGGGSISSNFMGYFAIPTVAVTFNLINQPNTFRPLTNALYYISLP